MRHVPSIPFAPKSSLPRASSPSRLCRSFGPFSHTPLALPPGCRTTSSGPSTAASREPGTREEPPTPRPPQMPPHCPGTSSFHPLQEGNLPTPRRRDAPSIRSPGQHTACRSLDVKLIVFFLACTAHLQGHRQYHRYLELAQGLDVHDESVYSFGLPPSFFNLGVPAEGQVMLLPEMVSLNLT
jgi:hypothetical protein